MGNLSTGAQVCLHLVNIVLWLVLGLGTFIGGFVVEALGYVYLAPWVRMAGVMFLFLAMGFGTWSMERIKELIG